MKSLGLKRLFVSILDDIKIERNIMVFFPALSYLPFLALLPLFVLSLGLILMHITGLVQGIATVFINPVIISD